MKTLEKLSGVRVGERFEVFCVALSIWVASQNENAQTEVPLFISTYQHHGFCAWKDIISCKSIVCLLK